MNVILVSDSDNQLDELLRASGNRLTRASLRDLASFAESAAQAPDAFVIDLRGHSAIPGGLTAVKRRHPAVGMLMVLPQLDAALMLEAMRAGVNECIAEPLRTEELQAALARIGGAAARRGDVFAIIGAKGGVGATTVAVNVATMLAKLRPTSALLIDLHPAYGDAGLFLGAEPRFSLVDAFENMHRMDATFLRSLITQTASGVHLLASSDRVAKAAISVASVRRLIELAASEYPYVVLDVPRSDMTMLDALDRAGTIVVVANQELATVRSAGRMAAMLEHRYCKDRVSVVMTRYNDQAEIAQEDVERVVGRRVSHVLPNNYHVALASQSKGRPLVLDNHNPLASALTRFTRSLAKFPADSPENAKPSGLFSRIGGRRR